jgi:hypothetical protein
VRAVVLKAEEVVGSAQETPTDPREIQWLTAAPEATAAAPPDAIEDGDMLLCP